MNNSLVKEHIVKLNIITTSSISSMAKYRPPAQDDFQTPRQLASKALQMIGRPADRNPQQGHHSYGYLTSSPKPRGSPRARGSPRQSYHPAKASPGARGDHMSYRSEM